MNQKKQNKNYGQLTNANNKLSHDELFDIVKKQYIVLDTTTNTPNKNAKLETGLLEGFW